MNRIYNYHIACILICLPFFVSAQKDFDKDFPKDLNQYTLLVERIPLEFLVAEFNERDSTAVVIEFGKIQYIQNLYLVKEPIFPCKLVDGDEVDSYYNSLPNKYRYVLKYKVAEKKINKVYEEVISFYFRDLNKKSDFNTLEDQNYRTKASLVLIYGLIQKAYDLPTK